MVDSQHRRKALRADATAITHGDKTLPLDRIGWVSYTAVHTATRRMLGPNSYDSDWTFECGPPGSGVRDSIRITFMGGGQAQTPPEWASLVAISQAHLEPRLLAEHHHRVLGGETVEIAAVTITREGVVLRSGVLPWSEVTAGVGNGFVHVHRRGVDRPVASVPLNRPNAVLIPRLFGALGSQ
ncbi:hypothetical protein ACOBQX_10175 [Actinokineospora sp. G85]|uniref:hypothetical protein n=1 Tax=Actinokineospora sp. G85 TaxID=3406626 RepID=UPI003C795F94